MNLAFIGKRFTQKTVRKNADRAIQSIALTSFRPLAGRAERAN